MDIYIGQDKTPGPGEFSKTSTNDDKIVNVIDANGINTKGWINTIGGMRTYQDSAHNFNTIICIVGNNSTNPVYITGSVIPSSSDGYNYVIASADAYTSGSPVEGEKYYFSYFTVPV